MTAGSEPGVKVGSQVADRSPDAHIGGLFRVAQATALPQPLLRHSYIEGRLVAREGVLTVIYAGAGGAPFMPIVGCIVFHGSPALLLNTGALNQRWGVLRTWFRVQHLGATLGALMGL